MSPVRLPLCLLMAIGWMSRPSLAETVQVVPDVALTSPSQPQVAVDAEGVIYIAYGSDHAIYCSVSTDGGKSYAPPVKVGQVKRLALGRRRGPRIAAGRWFIVVTAIADKLGGGRDGELIAWRSSDGGRSWQGPSQVNDVARSAREGLHAMAMGPNGQLFCTWLDLRNKTTQIFDARSTDGGATWSENRLVYHSPSGTVCQCCHPSVVYDSEGGLYVMWRNALDGYRDPFVATSADGGKIFAEAKKIGRGTWELDICPMDGGALAVVRPGKITTVWRRREQVFRTDPGRDDEMLLGAGRQPWAATSPEGAYLVWLAGKPADLWLASSASRRPIKLAAGANYPAVASPQAGPYGATSIMAAVVAPN